MNALSTAGLVKSYGRAQALCGVDVAVPAGSLYGLIGPNGAGKTTLLETLVGLRRPSAGTISLGVPHAAISYCPDVAEFEPWLKPVEVLDVACGLMGRSSSPDVQHQMLARVGLAQAMSRRVGGFSRGMTTRLSIAAALVSEPRVLLVDEPVAALDPAGRADVLRLLASLAPATTVVLSTHDLDDVEVLCDYVGVLNSGRLLYQGPLQELLATATTARWRLVVRPPVAPVRSALAHAPWVRSVNEVADGELEFTAVTAADCEKELPVLLAAAQARLVSSFRVRPSLEEVFLRLTGAPASEAEAS